MSYIVLYCIVSCIAQLSLIFFSYSANWSADTHRCKSEFRLLSVERASILNINLILSVSLIRLQTNGTYVVPKYYDQKLNMLTFSRHFIFNFIASKLYTISLLSSLNSRQGWGYDTSEEFDLRTDLGLRFASNSQSTDDRTSVITTTSTPPVSPHFPILLGYTYPSGFRFRSYKSKDNSGADLEASVTVSKHLLKRHYREDTTYNNML